ncbi:hypothetical protein A2V95_01510 [Candidatus Kuenenbacteria bacterium RBG_16_41_7]|uniref:Lipoprotein signal peptidase n=1 Tax=Candidatus Kuenenbacteria bacterium RBG_16_41_7 TaxID=1798560 RepID=A0A1F6GC09_9BACT|nr:MAG: hypothetical protein A2V95_01510 [Candidatus Kuenenbacteria bacterium RBG_16_41_7]
MQTQIFQRIILILESTLHGLPMTINNRKWLALSVGLIFFIADRLVKYLFVFQSINPGGSVFYYLENRNLAFSLPLPSFAAVVFYIFIFLIILTVISLFVNSWRCSRLAPPLAYWLVILGAGSNLLDRFKYGAVIDFIDFKIWPVFNLADVMIVVGLGLLSYDLFFHRKNFK